MSNSTLAITIRHIMGWLLFSSLIASFVASFDNTTNINLLLVVAKFLFFISIYIAAFYLNYWLLFPRLYLKRKFLVYVLITLILFAIIFVVKPFDNFAKLSETTVHVPADKSFPPPVPPPPFGDMKGPQHAAPPDRHFDIISLILFIMVWSISGALQLFEQWRNVLERAARAEAEKVTAELSFLRAQINPHFLFNTLNNIYSLSVQKSESASIAIMKLSKIMRYVTDEVTQDWVQLEDEIAFLADYIDLQRLRLSKKVSLDFSVSGDVGNKKIAPLILMPFVENIFKYGISNQAESTVLIKLSVEAALISFYCQNKIYSGPERLERTGIGITNTVQRLKHLYDGRHDLKISDDQGLFTVQLTIFV